MSVDETWSDEDGEEYDGDGPALTPEEARAVKDRLHANALSHMQKDVLV